MSATDRYRLHGFSVRCAPVLRAAPSPSTDVDIDLLFGPTAEIPNELPGGPVVLDQREAWDCLLVKRGTGFLYRVPEYYDVSINSDGSRAEVTWDSRDNGGMRPVLIGGGVIAILATLRGRSSLHATAVECDGMALALTGPAGRGKTTTAGLLLAAGASMIGDDVVAPVWQDGRFVVPRGLLELRFRDGAFDLAATLDASVRRTTPDKRIGVVPERVVSDDDTPLGAVVCPLPDHEGTEVRVREMNRHEAFLTLTASPRLEGWKEPRIVEQEFDLAARLADSVPVLEVSIPWGGSLDVTLGEQLRAALERYSLPVAP